MARCIELAKHGKGSVHPNPLVGSVIVHAGKIIGEGYHCNYGGPHAEVNAIASVKDQSLLKNATLYVNLEPCSHYGKTPPCSELIIRKQIPRVIIGCLDPFSEVSGRGIRMLKEAGVEVITGIMEKESFEVNKVFMTSHMLKRPYIYLKWAQCAGGFIDGIRTDTSVTPVKFSSPEMLQLVHKRRSEVSAIMVGTRTALLDNPTLSVRYWSGTSPLRVVLDKNLTIPNGNHLLDASIPTVIFTEKEKENSLNITYIRTEFNNNILTRILLYLYEQNITSLLVEGGTYLLDQFLCHDLWDEIQIETAPICLTGGVKAPDIKNTNNALLSKVSICKDKNAKEHIITVYSRKNQL